MSHPLTCADGHLGVWGAVARADAEQERQVFHRAYGRRYPKACERLDRDGDRMITYYHFPIEHWRHLRTTDVVESKFAAVRLRKLNAPALCLAVFLGVRHVDG